MRPAEGAEESPPRDEEVAVVIGVDRRTSRGLRLITIVSVYPEVFPLGDAGGAEAAREYSYRRGSLR
jgi:hypothetical protein